MSTFLTTYIIWMPHQLSERLTLTARNWAPSRIGFASDSLYRCYVYLGIPLKFSVTYTLIALAWCLSSYAAEDEDIESRIKANQLRASAAQNFTLSREQLTDLCNGLEGARWCEGYLAAILAALDVPRNGDCLPITDVAPFLYGSIWELTLNWLYRNQKI